MSEEQQRKQRVNVNLEIFHQVKRLYTTKTKQELLKITNLSLSACNFKFVSLSSSCLVFVVYYFHKCLLRTKKLEAFSLL